MLWALGALRSELSGGSVQMVPGEASLAEGPREASQLLSPMLLALASAAMVSSVLTLMYAGRGGTRFFLTEKPRCGQTRLSLKLGLSPRPTREVPLKRISTDFAQPFATFCHMDRMQLFCYSWKLPAYG